MIREHGLPAVVFGLERARSGIRGRLLVRDACIGLTGLAAITAVWRLVAAFVPDARVWSGAHAWPSAVMVFGIAAGVVATAVGAWLHAHQVTPTVLELARRADRRFGLQERLSTALELTAPGARGGSVALRPLLVADAASAGERVEPGSLVRVPLGRPVGWLVLGLVAVLAMQLVPLQTPGRPVPAAAAQNGVPVDSASLPTVTDVQRAAVLVTQDAFVRKDPNLKAVAAALQDLGARMAQGTIDPAQLAQAVASLKLQLEQAYGQGSPQTVSPGQQPGGSAASAKAPASSAAAPGHGQAAPAHGPSMKGAQKSASSSLSDLVQQLEAGAPNYRPSNSAAARSLNKLGSTPGSAASSSYGYSRNNPVQNALFQQQNALLDRPGQPGGQPVGAARHATKGPGDAAGNGAQPLSDGTAAAAATAPSGAGATKVILPAGQLAQGGQRIQLQASPDAKRTQIVDVAPGTAVAGAPPSETAPPAGPILDGRERDVVGRYFLPADASGSGGAAAQGNAP